MRVMDSHYKSNMGILDNFLKKIKLFLNSKFIDEFFWFILVFFVAVGSFALGMRYQREINLENNPIYIYKDSVIVSAWKSYIENKKNNANYIASKNGTVYYPIACSYGNKILEKNRIYFETESDAISSGYKKSSRCF